MPTQAAAHQRCKPDATREFIDDVHVGMPVGISSNRGFHAHANVIMEIKRTAVRYKN